MEDRPGSMGDQKSTAEEKPGVSYRVGQGHQRHMQYITAREVALTTQRCQGQYELGSAENAKRNLTVYCSHTQSNRELKVSVGNVHTEIGDRDV